MRGAKYVPTPSVLGQGEGHDWRAAGFVWDHRLQAMCWRSTLLHAGQSRRTVRSVDSGDNAWEANSRLDDCSETRDSLLEGNERFVNKLELDKTCGETRWYSDRDWAGSTDRKSQSSGVLFVDGAPPSIRSAEDSQ